MYSRNLFLTIALSTFLVGACGGVEDPTSSNSQALGVRSNNGAYNTEIKTYSIAGICIPLEGTGSPAVITASAKRGSCKGLGPASKKNDARSKAKDAALHDAAGQCAAYGDSAAEQLFWTWGCTNLCEKNGYTFDGGRPLLGLCGDDVTKVTYSSKKRGCGTVVKSKRFFADVSLTGSCGCVCVDPSDI
jgi:hypothetical protein